MYNSEHLQDKWLNENIFKYKKNGVFVEFGAIDGLITSNSLFFEEYLSWSGLCIEPIPDMFNKLTKNRKCICENYAIDNYVGETDFLVCDDVIGWSGISENIEPQHKDRLSGRGKHIIKVKVERLNNILEKHNLFDIDYMTIDTEGSEERIIKDIDFNKFNIKVLDVENNYDNYDVKDFLKKNGYKNIVRLDINDIFIKE